MKWKYRYYGLLVFAVGFFVFNLSQQVYPFLPALPKLPKISLPPIDIDVFPLKEVGLKGLNKLDPNLVVGQLGLDQKPSLLFLSKSKLKKRLELHPRLQVRSISKKYPHTILVDLKEEEGPFIVRDEKAIGGSLYEITEKGRVLAYDEDILDYDKFYIEWDSSWIEGLGVAREAVREELLSNFLMAYAGLPPSERDVMAVYSGIKLGAVSVMYLGGRNLKVLLNYPLSSDCLRRVRYASLYERRLPEAAKAIDLRHGLAKIVR